MRVALLSTVLLLVLAPGAVAADRSVGVRNFAFDPIYTRVDPGDTVTWRLGARSAVHTVTARRGSPARFDSGVLDPGQTFARTFSKPGTYRYLCRLHPDAMQAVVQVGPDRRRPRLARSRFRIADGRARVTFGLSELARVRVTLRRSGKVVRRVRTKALRQGRRSVALRLAGLRGGRYQLSVSARDLAGNASKVHRGELRIRR